MSATLQGLLDKTNTIAKIIYNRMGYRCNDFIFYEGTHDHPQERQCWNTAKDIMEELFGSNIDEVIEELREIGDENE